jgi:Mannosyltransferase (PIG-V)
MPSPADPAPSPAPCAQPPPAMDWREIAALFLGSRLLIWIIAGLSLTIVGKGPYFSQQTPGAGWFMRWDAGLYLILATHGYNLNLASPTANVSFLPLYPLLVRGVSLGGLLPPWLAGYLVSWACLWVACVWLWRAVAREWHDARLATLSVAFLLLGPVSFFFSTLYSEALFLPLAIGCLDSARRGRWWWAGVLGALASLTRFIGVILIVPLLWQWLESAGRAGRRRPPEFRLLLACLLPLTGFLAYCGYLWLRSGDPLLYFHAESGHFGRQFAWFYLLFARNGFTQQALFYQLWFAAATAVAFGLLLAGVCFRIPVMYSVYGLSAVGVYISSRLLEALPRYCSVIFPLYIVLALVARRWPRLALPLLATSTALLALSTILYVNGYWFT